MSAADLPGVEITKHIPAIPTPTELDARLRTFGWLMIALGIATALIR